MDPSTGGAHSVSLSDADEAALHRSSDGLSAGHHHGTAERLEEPSTPILGACLSG